MRCATCGTENAPDSRFCGGCGAKLAPSSRVAPTAKITDDASYPSQPPSPASIPPHGNYASGPASIPPQNHAPGSIPPQNAYVPPGSIPPQNAYVPSGSIPPQNNFAGSPGSIPPQNNAYDAPPKSIPPHNSFQRAATPIQTPPPGALKMPTPPPGSLSFAATPRLGDQEPSPPPVAAAEASRSLVAPPRRPIGLIVFVLLVDLALAGAGAVLLGKGLSEKKPAAKSEQKTQRDRGPQNDDDANVEARASNIETSSGTNVGGASTGSTTPPPVAAVNPSGGAAVNPSAANNSVSKPSSQASASRAAAPKGAAPQATATAPQATRAAPQATGSAAQPAPTATPAPSPTPAPAPAPAPAPTPAEPTFDVQLERATAASKASFDRCAADAGSPHGTVRVAFRVLEDGSVANAFPVENSTGAASLGQCLAQTITTWRFTPHTGAPINSLRAFNYP
jgi:TonB family protein